MNATKSISYGAEDMLQQRLEEVLFSLQKAAESSNENEEVIHDLRVGVRRAMAALKFFRKLLPKKRFQWMLKEMKGIINATNEVRDYDILIKYLVSERSDQIAAEVLCFQKKRSSAEKGCFLLFQRLIEGELLQRKIEKLLKKLTPTKKEPSLSRWAQKKWSSILSTFFNSLSKHKTGFKSLHRLRIHIKELRYTLELLSTIVPEKSDGVLLSELKTLQDKLGAIHDLVMVKEKIRARRKSVLGEAPLNLKRVQLRTRVELQEKRGAFFEAYTTEYFQNLKGELKEFL